MSEMSSQSSLSDGDLAHRSSFYGKVGSKLAILLCQWGYYVSFRRLARLKVRQNGCGLSAAKIAIREVLSAEFRVPSLYSGSWADVKVRGSVSSGKGMPFPYSNQVVSESIVC